MRMHALLATAFFVGLSPVASAQEAKQDFTLVNRTGYELNEIYVSPSKAESWEEDILGDDNLPDGESRHIRFKRAEKSCMWDLKVVYAVDDSSVFWRGINLCEVEKVTIRYNKDTDTTSASFD